MYKSFFNEKIIKQLNSPIFNTLYENECENANNNARVNDYETDDRLKNIKRLYLICEQIVNQTKDYPFVDLHTHSDFDLTNEDIEYISSDIIDVILFCSDKFKGNSIINLNFV